MDDTLAKSAQIHVRVTPATKRAVKIHCAQAGTTEQAWIEQMIDAALKKQAPELIPRPRRASGRAPRAAK